MVRKTAWWLRIGEELCSAAEKGDILIAARLLDQIDEHAVNLTFVAQSQDQQRTQKSSTERQIQAQVETQRLLALEWKDGNGYRPLHHAARCDSSDLAAMLLSHGSDPLAVDNRGRTAWELGVFGVNIPAMVSQAPALATQHATLEADPEQYKVVGAGTPCVDGIYRDDQTLERPPAGMLDLAPVPQFRQLRSSVSESNGQCSSLLLRRQGPHWWIVDAPSGLDLQQTVDEECYERGDETW